MLGSRAMFRPRPVPERPGAPPRISSRVSRTFRRKARGWSVAILLGSVLLVGCGGVRYDGRHYRGEDLDFLIGPPPRHWRDLPSDEALIAFRDDDNRATIAVNGRCHQDGDDVPLQALTHHLFLNFTDREVLEQRELMLDGRAALETELIAELDGVPKHFLVVVLKKDGCVYDFLHIADVSVGRAGQQEFRDFVSSFRVGVR